MSGAKRMMSARKLVRFALVVGVFQVFLFGATAQAQTDCSTQGDLPQSECQALVDFFNSTGGEAWNNNTNWNETNAPCSWFGLLCEAGTVTMLRLRGNNLVGSIPPSIGDLTNLELFDIQGNSVGGTIPASIGNLTNLVSLFLGGNQLTGSIPSELGNLPNLQFLSLGVNQLTGSIPPELANLTKSGKARPRRKPA